MTKTSSVMAIELRIMQMYIWALVAPKHINGQPVSLVRHGAYDVRLMEFPNPKKDTIPLWIELFDHEHNAALDSYGGCDLQEAAAAAQALISQARRLHRCATRRSVPQAEKQCGRVTDRNAGGSLMSAARRRSSRH